MNTWQGVDRWEEITHRGEESISCFRVDKTSISSPVFHEAGRVLLEHLQDIKLGAIAVVTLLEGLVGGLVGEVGFPLHDVCAAACLGVAEVAV